MREIGFQIFSFLSTNSNFIYTVTAKIVDTFFENSGRLSYALKTYIYLLKFIELLKILISTNYHQLKVYSFGEKESFFFKTYLMSTTKIVDRQFVHKLSAIF